jgi:hypothetical protein
MTSGRQRRRALCAAVLTVGAILVGAIAANASTRHHHLTDDQVAAWKQAHDTDPHLPLTAEQQTMQQQKDQAVRSALAGPARPDNPSPSIAYPPPSSANLAQNQKPQQTGYYCGPAAVAEALGQLGISISQATAAARLHTDTNGTAWSGGGTSPSNYPVPDVLNAAYSSFYWIPQAVSSSPSASEVTSYQNRIAADIGNSGAPVIGDAYEVPGGPHLKYHPDRLIFHWFDIRGYDSNGANTHYEDSVYGSPYVTWSSQVASGYSTMASSTIVKITGGRGYVW